MSPGEQMILGTLYLVLAHLSKDRIGWCVFWGVLAVIIGGIGSLKLLLGTP